MTTDRDNQPVSDAYREIATQTTPAELDERIMKLAADGVRSRYGLARAWIRPVAWAATIALSVALVLEFMQVEDTVVPLGETNAIESAAPAAREEAAIEQRTRSDADTLKVKEEKDMDPQAAKQAPAMPATVSFESANVAEDVAEAEEQALERSADVPAAGMMAVAPAGCGEEARAAADTWYACIEDLREQDRDVEADAELEMFRQAHPDYDPDAE